VRADFKAAGFKLVGRSFLLFKFIQDPAVHGKTDRFILRFVKA
jgi:predicted methyltransferase